MKLRRGWPKSYVPRPRSKVLLTCTRFLQLNAPGADKLGIDKIVAEWIPFKISHRLAYVAAFYVCTIL